MSSQGNKNRPTSKSLADKQRVKCVKFSKASGDERPINPVKSNSLKKSCIRTVSNTDGSVKSCSSSVVAGFDLTDSIDRENISVTSDRNDEVSSELDQTDNFKLAVPELCTSLKIANNLLGAVALAKDSRSGLSVSGNKNVALAKAKALSVMNVPFEEQVFKDLIALNINSDELAGGAIVKSKRFERVKDNEPELSNYFNPSFNNEFIMKCVPMPFEIDKNLNFDGFSITERARHWESRD